MRLIFGLSLSSRARRGEEGRGGERVAFCESDMCLVDFSAFDRGVSMLIPVWLKWMRRLSKERKLKGNVLVYWPSAQDKISSDQKVVAEC